MVPISQPAEGRQSARRDLHFPPVEPRQGHPGIGTPHACPPALRGRQGRGRAQSGAVTSARPSNVPRAPHEPRGTEALQRPTRPREDSPRRCMVPHVQAHSQGVMSPPRPGFSRSSSQDENASEALPVKPRTSGESGGLREERPLRQCPPSPEEPTRTDTGSTKKPMTADLRRVA